MLMKKHTISMSWKQFIKAVDIYCLVEGCRWNHSPEKVTCLLNPEDIRLVEGKCPKGHPLWVKITMPEESATAKE